MTRTRESAVLASELSALYAALLEAESNADEALTRGTMADYEAAADRARKLVARIHRVEMEQAVIRSAFTVLAS